MSSKYREILVTEMPEMVSAGGYLVRYSCGHVTRRFPTLPDDSENVHVDYHYGIQYYDQQALEKYDGTWKVLGKRYGNSKKPCPLCCESVICEEFPEMFRVINEHENFHRGVKNSLSRVKYNRGYLGLADNAVRRRFASSLDKGVLLSTQYELVSEAVSASERWESFGWGLTSHACRWLNNLDRLQKIFRQTKLNESSFFVTAVIPSEVLTRLSPDLHGVISGCCQHLPAEGIIRGCAVSAGRFSGVRQIFSTKFMYGSGYFALGVVKYLMYLLEEDVLDPALHLSGPLSGLALAKFSGIWPQVKQELEELDFDPKGASL